MKKILTFKLFEQVYLNDLNPFDKEKEQPQISRSIENQISIIRPYCCGWLFPALYFQGHTQIVGQDGEILAESTDWEKQKIFYADLALKPKILK